MSEDVNGHEWNVTKDKLIREIQSTNEAISKFKKQEFKTIEELNQLSMEDLSNELKSQTELLDQLVANWDIQT